MENGMIIFVFSVIITLLVLFSIVLGVFVYKLVNLSNYQELRVRAAVPSGLPGFYQATERFVIVGIPAVVIETNLTSLFFRGALVQVSQICEERIGKRRVGFPALFWHLVWIPLLHKVPGKEADPWNLLNPFSIC